MKSVLIFIASIAALNLFAADPAFYQKQATWQETLRVSREALMACRIELNQLLQVAADMIRAGVFAQNATPDNCRNCEYRPICGNAIEPLTARKITDPRLAPFLAIKEIA